MKDYRFPDDRNLNNPYLPAPSQQCVLPYGQVRDWKIEVIKSSQIKEDYFMRSHTIASCKTSDTTSSLKGMCIMFLIHPFTIDPAI